MSDEDIVHELVDEMGKYTDVWGMGVIPGKIWGLLYFNGPMTQNQIKNELGYALGAISDALSKLENFGVVSIIGKEGRKNIYNADFSGRKKIRSMCDVALHTHINPMIDMLEDKSNKIRNKELKEKVTTLKTKYAKGASKIKLILKFVGK